MSSGPRPTSVASGILIHPAVGHHTPTLQTDRQTGQRSHSICRTDSCNGRPETVLSVRDFAFSSAVVVALGAASLPKVKRLSVIEVGLVIQQVFQKFKK